MLSTTTDTPDNILPLVNKVRFIPAVRTAFSLEAMNNLGKSNVFLSGLGGLGLEIGIVLLTSIILMIDWLERN